MFRSFLLFTAIAFMPLCVHAQWNGTDYKKQNEQKEREYKKRFAKNTDIAISRNVLIVGLKLGGGYFLGAEYEYRLSNHLGCALGIGFAGYETGLKFHLKPTKHGHLFYLNYKDVYFGKESILSLEYGWNIPFRRANLRTKGFYFHGGLGGIMYIDPTLKKQIYGGDEFYSPVNLTLGCGISF